MTKYQIQFKCTRWCNAGNYSKYVKEFYTDIDEAKSDLKIYQERINRMNDNREIRLVVVEGRKYTEIT